MLAPAEVEAVTQARLGASAAHVVQQHGAAAVAEVAKARSAQRRPAARLAAGHACISKIPVIVAHGAPTPGVHHLHAAATRSWAAHQPQPPACRAHRPMAKGAGLEPPAPEPRLYALPPAQSPHGISAIPLTFLPRGPRGCGEQCRLPGRQGTNSCSCRDRAPRAFEGDKEGFWPTARTPTETPYLSHLHPTLSLNPE